jgi:hypothetical protein
MEHLREGKDYKNMACSLLRRQITNEMDVCPTDCYSTRTCSLAIQHLHSVCYDSADKFMYASY